MANFEVIFKDSILHEDIHSKIVLSKYKEYIDIIIYDTPKNGDGLMCLTLDKSTAIKFAKTLRTEINKITESEVVDG